MSIGSKMRGLGESSYYTKLLEEPIKEILGDKKYIFTKDPIDGVVLHTDRVDDETLNQLDEVLYNEKFSNIRLGQYNHHIEISRRDINKYNACTTIAEILEVNPDAGSDLTSDGEWVYPLDSMKYFNSNPANNPFRQESKIVKFAVPLPNASNMREAFGNNKSMKHLELYIPKAGDCASMLGGMDALEYLDLYAPNAELSIYIRRMPR